MHRAASLLLFSLVAVVHAQQAGTLTTETHPSLTIQQCTSSGCTTLSRSVTLDANWRWVHDSSGTNCYTGNEWDTSICDTPTSCAEDCYLDGADYQGTYGVTSSGDALTLDFVTGSNVGSRLYLLENESTYQTFDLRNQEFTFTVDVSNLPCGLNGALYFSQMYADGGVSEYSNNNAGAKYGAGYCDTQCPQDLKFIGGLANVAGWTPSTNNANTGTGDMGSCCMELDIWEANAYATALTPHVCSNTEPAICTTADECGNTTATRYDSYCDHDGCDFNPYRMGNTTFYGEGMTIDTTSPFTVVTQFITSDGTSTGTLSEIRRLYVQNDVVIENSYSDISGMSAYNSITDDYCVAQKTAFGDTDEFETLGGLAQLSEAFEAGMVLVLSLWDDYTVDMLWLDSDYPTDESTSDPGVARGPCSTSSGVPATVESDYPSSNVIYSNIKYGDIGTTY